MILSFSITLLITSVYIHSISTGHIPFRWAEIFYIITPRMMLFALASAATVFCARMYRIQKNLQAMNEYRATALSSFASFINVLVEEGKEEQNVRDRKEKLFDELARLIYEPIHTGYTDDQKLKTSEIANMIATAMRNAKAD